MSSIICRNIDIFSLGPWLNLVNLTINYVTALLRTNKMNSNRHRRKKICSVLSLKLDHTHMRFWLFFYFFTVCIHHLFIYLFIFDHVLTDQCRTFTFDLRAISRRRRKFTHMLLSIAALSITIASHWINSNKNTKYQIWIQINLLKSVFSAHRVLFFIMTLRFFFCWCMWMHRCNLNFHYSSNTKNFNSSNSRFVQLTILNRLTTNEHLLIQKKKNIHTQTEQNKTKQIN